MIHGAILLIPSDFDIKQLYEISWERSKDDYDLKSFIQFESHFYCEPGIRGDVALAVHQELKSSPDWQEVSGRYYLSSKDEIIPKFAPIFIIPGFIVVDKINNRPFVRDIINNGLKDLNFALEISLDTNRIAIDHRDLWGRGFSERVGKVTKGTVYGDKVDQDPIFGPAMKGASTKAIGWHTTFFGGNIAVWASPRGAVKVWAQPDIPKFIEFLRTEILPYRLPMLRQTRIS